MIKTTTFSTEQSYKQFKTLFLKGVFPLFLLIGFNPAFSQTKSTLITAGTSSFTAPTGVTSVTVQLWGAGGAGGGSNVNKKAASGGGGGAYNFSNTIAVTPGTTYTNSVIVGAGGTGANGTNGTNGGNSSVTFGSGLTGNGGKGGAANGINVSPLGDGGAAGIFAGGNGGSGVQGVNGQGGGGASSAGTASAGNNGTATAAGAAVTGGGAGGAQGAQSVDGTAGSSPGGGGGGGGDKAGANSTAGGIGGTGQAIISYFLLTSTSNVTVCNGTAATITVSGTAANLPVGSYTVIYDLGSPNSSINNSTTMTVSTAGTGTFSTSTLSNVGSTAITITSITSTINGITYKTTYDSTGNANNKAIITVSANSTAGAASSSPTLCINTALTAITHATTGAIGIGTATGLPSGVTASFASNTITISGTPTSSGTFNYSITLTGGCGSINATGTIIVTPANTAGTASSNPTLCINTVLTPITRTTTGATGIGTATGLPSGVTASFASNTITISGTPTASGTFNYSIPLTGGCGSVSATGTIMVTPNNTAGTASSSPTLCINTALTAITHATTGATGIGSPTGLPTGVTAAFSSNTITISGTPAASGTFNYSIPLTGGCGSVSATGTITVTPANTAGTPSSTPTLCINTVLTPITRTTTGATGIGTATGLPSGVTASFASNTITISGTPTASGTFNYSIPLTGGCGSVSATGTIIVTPNNTAGAASSSPTLCINTALTAITHTTTGATGIGTATGLPSGVTAAFASNIITISGTPTSSGTFNYSIPLTGGCGSVNATGTIMVTPNNTAGTASSSPTLCINTALTAITYTTTGATGIGTAIGLPSGVTASFASNTITISGTPTASGTFNYSIPLTGGCGSVSATGTITVTPANTAGTPSSTPTLCINTALTAITRTTTGATGIGTATGLPSGVTASFASNTITISGTPTASGTFNYSIPLTGGCGSVSATGTIIVTPNNTAGAASSSPTLCINTALTAITHATTGATGIGTATGLPSGVTASFASNTITISGTPTASGTFNYSIPLTGGCGGATAIGTITVRSASTAAVISGSATICSGSSTDLHVAITGGTSPYTVVYSGGTASTYTSGSNISVTPSSTTNYTLTSVTDANGCVGSGNSGSANVIIDVTTSTNGGISWSNGTPNGTKSAVFDGSSATLATDFFACSLRLTNNAIVTVSSGIDVTLNGKLTADSGSTFTLSNTANLIQNSTIADSGNIVVKRNSSALKRLDYTLWSSPVTGQGVYAFSPFTFANRFYVYNTSTDLYNNPAVGLNVTGLNTDGVNGTDSNNVQFAAAKSYLIRVPWNHPTTATVWNGTFSGVPNNGNVSFAMASGYNAVGNPYPSRINVYDFIDGNTNISGPLYFWRKTNDNTATSYATLTKTAYVANGAAGGDTGTGYFNTGNEANWVINIGQGFIVNATSSSNLTFTNSMRRSSNTDQFFRTNSQSVNTANNGLYWLNLNTSTGVYSQMAVGYSSEGTLAEDRGIDGKNINHEFYLTSLIGADEYSIQGRPDFDAGDIVPLSYKTTTAGTYSISIDHTAGAFNGGSQPIYLKDNLTTTINNLNAAAYTFTSEVGTFANRFEIIYQSPLGTEHSTFTANNVIVYNQNNEVVINAGNIIMTSIKVFDVRGRLLQEKKGINSSQTTIDGGLANEVLLVQITSEDGLVVTKKVIQ